MKANASTQALEPSHRTTIVVFLSLLGLLVLSAASSRLLTGKAGVVVALVFAAAKTTLIFVYFMRLRYQSGLVRLFAVAGFFWLGLIGLFTFADYLTRG
jgi:cytochrome c oxidase subunit IV